MNKKGFLGRVMGGFIAIMIGVSLIPSISQKIKSTIQSSNTPISEPTQILLNLLPVFFALTILGIAIAIVYTSFSDVGLIGDSKEVKSVIKKPKPHRQTYLEYVKERLEIERLMRRH